MVKQTIQIYARVKPLGRRQPPGICSVDEDETSAFTLEIIVPHDLADGFVNNKRESYKFKFQKVFDQEAKQDEIFETIAKPVAECALAGYNGTIFAYGQTGSGKTFTITGGAERYSDRGIIPRTLSYIFQQLQKDSSKVYTTHISYLEIYNECGYDLLDPRHEASRLEDLPKVTIMEDPDQNIHLKHLSLQQANNEEEALNLLFLGDTNRMIAETPMNQASTRSHCIFTIHISSKEPGSATIRRSKLHLVDLAGSERVAKTGVGGQLLTEAKYINLSLHYLEQVIIALSEKNRSHIPYRNSMMTSVLRDSLGGNCMTTMIATLSIEKRNIDESISTCRFAQRVALIKNEAVLNEEIDPRLMIARLKKEIQDLKDELAMVTGEQRLEELTEEELLQIGEQIKSFLEDTDPESMLEVGADMRKIRFCFTHLKRLINDPKLPDNRLLEPDIPGDSSSNSLVGKEELKKLKELLQQRDNEINILVSMLKKEKKKLQDALLQLNASSKGIPSSESSLLWKNVDNEQVFSVILEPKSGFLPRITGVGGEMSLGRQEAFEIFKNDYADSITIEDNKQLLKQRFAEAKSLGERVNETRNKINHLKGEITQLHMQRAVQAVVSPHEMNEPDPVEEAFRAQMEEEKKRYKTMFNRLKGLKIEIEHLQLLMEKAKVKLQRDFEVWWSEEATHLEEEKPPLLNPVSVLKTAPLFPEAQTHPCGNRKWHSFSKCLPTGSNGLNEGEQIEAESKQDGGAHCGGSESEGVPNNSRASFTEEAPVKCSVSSLSHSASKPRISPAPSSSIPFTGDHQTDADILAFIRARQKLLHKKGLGNK
ncbi:kinesin-like protein KIF6 isoform X2 [Hemicordylus capensis]|uniref:kinesin-like protein KIF6 isoform X2 n=1 Tax=Hemicordylus capensis TaxID=884348 RepID=UPI0023041E4E|nr:kinesin-like protein KIF6 isoform X2 [Hemicordylus capensis]